MPVAAREKRYGTIAARIASQHAHRTGINIPTARAGTVCHFIVQDVSRKTEEAKHAKWVCRHPSCAHKHWPSKADLLADHPENRILKQQQETHLYMAVAEIEGTSAVAEKKDDKGRVVVEAREAQPPRVVLLSDEE